MVQNTLRSHPGSVGCDLSEELSSRAVPIHNYLAILTQLGAHTALHIALPPRPAGGGGANLIDSESSDDGLLLSARKDQVGDALHTRHYVAPHQYHEDPSVGTVPAGYRPVTIAGIPCYSNKQPPTGTSLYSDGSLQTVEIAGSEYQAASAAVAKGPLRILALVADHSSPTGLKCTEQPSYPTVTLNTSTTWLSQNAHTTDPRTNVPTLTSATKCATRCNTNASPWIGSPATALRRRPVARRNANKFGAMGK